MSTHLDASFVPVAEAAYLAGLTDRQLQRTMDENILEAPLVTSNGGRRFAKLAIALAKFYFSFERNLTADARRDVISLLTTQLQGRSDWPEMLSLERDAFTTDWTIALPGVSVNLDSTVRAVQERMAKLTLAQRKIRTHPDTLGGAPVFVNTRVPIDVVLSMKKAGSDLEEINRHYPTVTSQLIDAAETFRAVNPKRGRPSAELPPSWKVASKKSVSRKK